MDDRTENNTSPSEMLEGMLSNPELLRRVSELLGKGDSPPPSPPPADAPPPKDALSGLLQDPAFLQKLPQMMEMLRPMMSGGNNGAPKSPDASLDPATKRRNDLLRALKPFLSPSRASAVDAIIRLSYLGSLQGLLS